MELLKVEHITAQVKRRAFRKMLTIEVSTAGDVIVRSNKTTPTFFIKSYIAKNKNWIDQQIKSGEQLRKENPPKQYLEGEEFLLLGNELKLCLKFHNFKRVKVLLEKQNNEFVLSLFSLEELSSKDIRKHVVKFYKSQAKEYLSLRAKHWAEVTGLEYSDLNFKNQKRVWGTCSNKGVVCLNIKLVAAPLEVIDYVIIHELCHLKHHNHSKQFWELVTKFEPNYKEIKTWLDKNQFAFDFLSNSSEIHN